MIFDLAARYSALCFVLPQLTRVSAAIQARSFFLTTTTVDINFSHVLSSFLQSGVFLDHLLVTIAGEVNRQFGVLVARAGARPEIGVVDTSALPGEKLLNAVGAVVSPALIIARSPRRPRRLWQ